ncbi:MAG: segregation/condensation protein A [Patescibacteria group bacterium]
MAAFEGSKANFTISLEKFDGPLDLLLKLIEQDKLAITEVAIAHVTEQYLKVIRETEGGMHPELLADFLVVAAKLLFYKSRALFPQLNVAEEEGESLEYQLRLYQKFVEASKAIEKLFHRRHYAFARERLGGFVSPEHGEGGQTETVFAPPSHLKSDRMYTIMLQVLKSLEPIVKVPKTIIRRMFSLRDTIRRIEELLCGQEQMRFGSLLNGAQNRTEIVVTFLALLELVKQRTVVVTQAGMFEEMTVVKILNPKP